MFWPENTKINKNGQVGGIDYDSSLPDIMILNMPKLKDTHISDKLFELYYMCYKNMK